MSLPRLSFCTPRSSPRNPSSGKELLQRADDHVLAGTIGLADQILGSLALDFELVAPVIMIGRQPPASRTMPSAAQ